MKYALFINALFVLNSFVLNALVSVRVGAWNGSTYMIINLSMKGFVVMA